MQIRYFQTYSIWFIQVKITDNVLIQDAQYIIVSQDDVG